MQVLAFSLTSHNNLPIFSLPPQSWEAECDKTFAHTSRAASSFSPTYTTAATISTRPEDDSVADLVQFMPPFENSRTLKHIDECSSCYEYNISNIQNELVVV